MREVLGLALRSAEYCLRRGSLLSAPAQLSLEPTNHCNFRCSFCPQSNPRHLDGRSGKMSLAQCRDLLERAVRDFFPRRVTRKVSFTHDGEPFLNEDFPEFLRLAAGLGYRIKFASNGYLLRPDVVDSLLADRVRFNPCVDFCSDRALFESCRGTPGSWEVVLRNLRHCVQRAEETGGAIFLDICDISAWKVVDPSERAWRLAELRSLLGLTGSTAGVALSPRRFHNMTGDIRLGPAGAGKRDGYHLCPYPWFNFNVTWDGTVVACCRDLDSKTVLGNVFSTDSLREIWNGGPYAALRRSLSAGHPQEIEACRGCDLPWDSTRWSAGYVLLTLRRRILRSGRG